MATWSSEARFPFPNYENAYLTFSNGKQEFKLDFMISPSSYSVSIGYDKSTVPTLSGWHLFSSGASTGVVNFSGVLLDSFKLQERLNILLQFQNLMQNNRNDLKEYMNKFKSTLVIEGVRYNGAVQSFAFSKSQDRQFLYSYSMSFVFVDFEILNKVSQTLPKFARNRIAGGKDKFELPYHSISKKMSAELKYSEVNLKSKSRVYSNTDTSSVEEKKDKEEKQKKVLFYIVKGDPIILSNGVTECGYAKIKPVDANWNISRYNESIKISTYLVQIGETFSTGITAEAWGQMPYEFKESGDFYFKLKTIIYLDEENNIRKTSILDEAVEFKISKKYTETRIS